MDDRLFTEAEPVIAAEVGRLALVLIGCFGAAYAGAGTTVELGTPACIIAVSIWLSLWARARVRPQTCRRHM